MKLLFILSFSVMVLAAPTQDYMNTLSCLKSVNMAGIKYDSITQDGLFLLNGSAQPKLGTYVTSTSTGKTFFIPFDKESGYFNESNTCFTRYYYRNANIEGKSLKLCIGVGQKVGPNQKRTKPKQMNSSSDKDVNDKLKQISEYCIPEGGDHTKSVPTINSVAKKDSLCEKDSFTNCCLGSSENNNFIELLKQEEASSIDLKPHLIKAIKETVESFEKKLPRYSNYVANKAEDEKRKTEYLKILNDCRSQISDDSIKTFLTSNIEFIKNLNYMTNSKNERRKLAEKLQINNLPDSQNLDEKKDLENSQK